MSPRSLGKYRCQPVGLKPGCMCARVSVFGVCLSAADLWGLLILTGEAASASLPAPPPASTWQTDRQADRQLSSQLVNLSPLTPTWDSQVCTWEVTNLPFLRTSAPWLGQHPCPPPPRSLGFRVVSSETEPLGALCHRDLGPALLSPGPRGLLGSRRLLGCRVLCPTRP